MKTIKRRHMGRDVIQAPHEVDVKVPLNIAEYSRIADYGTLCYPNQEDVRRHPDARAIIFFNAPEKQYILTVDDDGHLVPSCKALFGGFIWLRGGDRIYFGPNMSEPLVPENMLTRDGRENENREIDPVTWEHVTSDEQIFIDRYDEEQAEIDDKAMTERRGQKDHFETGDRAQYLTPRLMPEEPQEILVTGKFFGFLQMTNKTMPHAMVFEVGHPSRADNLKRRMIIPLPYGSRFEEQDVPSIYQEVEMEDFFDPDVEVIDKGDAPYHVVHPLQGDSSDDCHGTPEDQGEGHRPLAE